MIKLSPYRGSLGPFEMSNSSIGFPNEILERILFFSNPETVENAKKIDSYWFSIVSSMYVTKNYWEKVCKQYINPYDLYELRKSLSAAELNSSDYWELVYKQWHSWSNLETVKINIRNFPVREINGEIHCTKIIGDHELLIGTNLGFIYHYNIHTGFYITEVEHCNGPILKIDSMDVQTQKKLNFKSPYIFLQCETSHILMYQLNDESYGETYFPVIKLNNVTSFRFQYDHFVYSDCNNVLRLGVFKNKDDRLQLETLFSMSLNDRDLAGLSIWDSFVTTLYPTVMEVFKFRNFNEVAVDNDITRSSTMLLRVDKWSFKRNPNSIIDAAFYKGIYISVAHDQVCVKSLNHDFQKRFVCGSDYGVPSTVLLFGRILVIGCERAKIYFYRVDNWAQLKLEEYTRMVTLDSCDESITNISMHEVKNKHIIVVTTASSIKLLNIDF